MLFLFRGEKAIVGTDGRLRRFRRRRYSPRASARVNLTFLAIPLIPISLGEMAHVMCGTLTIMVTFSRWWRYPKSWDSI